MDLYVNESGSSSESAETIVLLHGGGASGWTWRPVVDQLQDYHLLVPDLPEHGKSAGVKPFSMSDAAERIVELIRNRAHGEKAHVVGLSLGAQVTVQLLATQPEVADRCIISGTLVRPIAFAGAVDPVMRLYAPFRNAGFLVRANMKALDIPAKYFPEFAEDTRLSTPESLGHIFSANLGFRIPSGLERVNRPVMVVVGQREPKATHLSAQDLIQAIPGAKGYVATGHGHNWSLEAPDLFARVVRAWVSVRHLPPEMTPLTRS